MNYLFLTVSMLTMVAKNCIFNTAGKKLLKRSGDIYRFNSCMYLLCAAAFFALALFSGISLYTVGLGILFGLVTFLSNVFSLRALATGTMHITVLITTSSMMIPTVFGMILSRETPSIPKLLSMAALIGFIYLSSGKDKKAPFQKRWLVYCAIAFVSQGAVGILQKIHQISPHKDELFAFLGCSFAMAFVLAMLLGRGGGRPAFTKKHYLLALACGGCIFTMNLINLKLSGVIPSQIFFPLVNGSSIVLSSLTSIFIYKEKITGRQVAGLVGGIACLLLICLLP